MATVGDADSTIMSSTARQLKLRRPDVCAVCARELAAGEAAIWDSARRHARCTGCEPASTPTSAPTESDGALESEAGASARREYERRRDRREAGIRSEWGPFGGVAVALSS